MKKLLLTTLLSLTGLILLAAVGLGLFLTTFDPNVYREQLGAAVERATGRSVQFQGDLEIRFFPKLGLKTGRIVLADPDIFGDEPFLSVESASLQVALGSLLDRVIAVEEVALHGARLNLKTNVLGQNNWEHSDMRGAARDVGREYSESLQDPGVQGDTQRRFALTIQEISFTDARVSYRNMQTGTAYSGRLDPFIVTNPYPDVTIPLALSGTAANDNGRERVRFDLRAEALFPSTDDSVSIELRHVGLRGEGFGIGVFQLQGAASLRYDRGEGALAVSGLRGSAALPPGEAAGSRGMSTEFIDGFLSFVPAKGMQAPRIDGSIALTELNVDVLQRRLGPAVATSPGDSVRGAPNMTRPTVGGAGGSRLDPQLAREIQELRAFQAERGAAQAGATAVQAGPNWIDGGFAVTAERLLVKGLPVQDFRLDISSEEGRATVPFSMSLFNGTVSGTAQISAANMPDERLSFALSGQVKELDMAAATDTLSGKYTITGILDAACDLAGKGRAWGEIVHSLSGTIQARVGGGEIRGFHLIPDNLPGGRIIPVNFPFERLSASANVEQGVAQSRDFILQSDILAGRGGGKVFFAYGQADFGLEFLLGGMPPAIPVNISGPFGSLSTSVDMRIFLRNVTESAAAGSLPPPDAARELLRSIGNMILR